jgi:hypothetical protein
MKQTAVDWLKDMLEWNYGDPKMLEISWVNLDDLFERAKQMEKEQIKQAYLDSSRETCLSYGDNPPHDDPKFAEKYYQETFNTKKE